MSSTTKQAEAIINLYKAKDNGGIDSTAMSTIMKEILHATTIRIRNKYTKAISNQYE